MGFAELSSTLLALLLMKRKINVQAQEVRTVCPAYRDAAGLVQNALPLAGFSDAV